MSIAGDGSKADHMETGREEFAHKTTIHIFLKVTSSITKLGTTTKCLRPVHLPSLLLSRVLVQSLLPSLTPGVVFASSAAHSSSTWLFSALQCVCVCVWMTGWLAGWLVWEIPGHDQWEGSISRLHIAPYCRKTSIDASDLKRTMLFVPKDVHYHLKKKEEEKHH